MSRVGFPLGVALILTAVVAVGATLFPTPSHELQFVVTADAHYGLTRTAFRGGANVDAHVVNAALVARLNTLPAIMKPRTPSDSTSR